MENLFFQIETLVIELLLVISIVAMMVQYLRVPYTVALVITGLLISILRPQIEAITGPIQLELTSELILALLVPPLIFEAAFNLDFDKLRRSLGTILVLAIPGVIVSMFIVGGVVAGTTGLSISVALVFGALISATDPVSVIALFKSLGVPKRLAVLVEGESLLNDGTAIVVFNLVLGIAVAGAVEFTLLEGVIDFVTVVAGGLIIGIVLGTGISWLISRVDNHLVETTLTTVLAFGAFLIAERLHVSGVLAVVAAGILNGNSSSRGMSPTTRIILNNFWEYIAFLANSFIFLLIGFEVDISELLADWQPILFAIVAVLAARMIVVYVTTRLIVPVTKRSNMIETIPNSWQHVLVWGGVRGAISLALALSLPFALGADRVLLIHMTFGVVLFSLFVQGTSIGWLLSRLGIVKRDERQEEYDLNNARLFALRSAEAHLNELHDRHLVSQQTYEEVKQELNVVQTEYRTSMQHMLIEHPEMLATAKRNVWRDLLQVQRDALLDLRRDGTISEQIFEEIAVGIDQAIDSDHPHQPHTHPEEEIPQAAPADDTDEPVEET
ncbi:Na+/H+ antiporter [Phototrophicus methaneseepsis]|uniref:Na+/H+ antiporter n=1 Tax=Phototrophicus methaneseepsis TaxID=2710758 RepID=A0A7S8E9U4_9CHLR|nr:Na+/H+ antiporter [Phototrophicus methaneseepsis]QPC82898.1 Na+/H+ antiporter [Phototrophicus methaneseepsis]